MKLETSCSRCNVMPCRAPGQAYCFDCHAQANREYRRRHRRKVNTRERARYARDREERQARHAARLLLYIAKRRGDIVTPEACSKCGATDCRIDGHHADYTKPLEVEWLCPRCHGAKHRRQQ
jgi:hypothetical protein